MEDYSINSKDIVLQSIYPKRLVIALGEHAEFIVDASTALEMLDLMRESRHENSDLDRGDLRAEYSKGSDPKDCCMVRFNDFSINRLSSKEFKKLERGFADFFKWAAEYKLPISEPFIRKIK